MKRANETIRKAAERKGIKLWQIADRMGMADSNFCRKLRKELSDAEREQVLTIIDELAAEEDI